MASAPKMDEADREPVLLFDSKHSRCCGFHKDRVSHRWENRRGVTRTIIIWFSHADLGGRRGDGDDRPRLVPGWYPGRHPPPHCPGRHGGLVPGGGLRWGRVATRGLMLWLTQTSC